MARRLRLRLFLKSESPADEQAQGRIPSSTLHSGRSSRTSRDKARAGERDCSDEEATEDLEKDGEVDQDIYTHIAFVEKVLD